MAKQKNPEKKKRLNKMDVILIVIAAALLVFTIKMIRIFEETGTIPDTLVTCVYATLGGECGAMAWIKNAKERNKDREWQKEDRAYEEQHENEVKDQELL